MTEQKHEQQFEVQRPWKDRARALEGVLRTRDFGNVKGAGDKVSSGWKESQLSYGALNYPGPPCLPEQSLRVCHRLSQYVFLALPIAAPLLHVSFVAGAGSGGSQNSPLWNGEARRAGKRRTKSEGAAADQQGGLPLAQLPGPEPEEGAACPSPFPPPAPQGSLAAEPASWAPAKPNSCQGERKKHFRAERPLWALIQA